MRPIPTTIKIEIFRKYLEGFSMPEINKLYNNVSVGSIHSITKEEVKKDDAFIYIREIAKKLRKDSIDIYDLIPEIHLNSKIKTLGLNYDLFEDFLDSADIESFRINMNFDEFLKRVKEILNFEKYNNIKIINKNKEKYIKKNKILNFQNNIYIKKQYLIII